MFIWTTGIPQFGLVLFVAVALFVLYSLARTVRERAWETDETSFDGDGQRDDRPRNTRSWRCSHADCRAVNPGHARFCRMCGRRRRRRRRRSLREPEC